MMSRRPAAFSPLVAILALIGLSAPPAAAEVKSAWVQLTGQHAEVRAVIMGAACPEVVVNGRSMAMERRVAANALFPTVCALTLPAGAASATIEGRSLPIPAPARRIVVMGDTGCEVKELTAQACNDPRAWPFAQVSRLAAAYKPDLVIHLGDYYYREAPCPLAFKACAGSPYGDRWETWAAEFFDPAAPLLQAAPWVFARGNHEACTRGWRGWYALLDAGPAPAACPFHTDAFAVRTGDLNLYVIDSADAPDRNQDPLAVRHLKRQLDGLGAALDSGQGWLITHRPIWGLVPVARLGPAPPVQVSLNFTEQEAVRGRPLAGVQMVLSGHVHNFQALNFGPARPAQLIVGSGGDSQIKADRPDGYGGRREIDGLDASTFAFRRFGFFVLDKDGEDWTGAFHDLDDKIQARCRLHARALTCDAAP